LFRFAKTLSITGFPDGFLFFKIYLMQDRGINLSTEQAIWGMMVGGNLMRLFFWSIVGGLVGTGLMDIVGIFATEKLKIRWGG